MQNKPLILGAVLVVLVLAGGFYLNSKKEPGAVACTMEAKVCPDGTSVGRSGPACEFSECPTTEQPTKTGVGIGETVSVSGVAFTPLEVTQESRCASDVTCIQAGTVQVRTKVVTGATSQEMVLTLGTSVSFGGKQIQLVTASPYPISTHRIQPAEYQFTFSVSDGTKVTGMLSGTVTTSPTCPVERNPPDPQCAPKPYGVFVDIVHAGYNSVYKTVETSASGEFSAVLEPGSYELHLRSKTASRFPVCPVTTVDVVGNKTTFSSISCDTGIR